VVLLKLIDVSDEHVAFSMFLGNFRVFLLRGCIAEYLRGGDVALAQFDRKLQDILGSEKMCLEVLTFRNLASHI
jgi:hypothetical protein